MYILKETLRNFVNMEEGGTGQFGFHQIMSGAIIN